MTDAIYQGNAPANQDTLPESVFQPQVLSMAANLGWTHRYHTHYAVGSDPGYPDLTLVHPSKGVVWLEIKGGRNPKISERQVDWLEALQGAGQQAYLVYPADYDAVARLLHAGVADPGDVEALIANQYRYQAVPFRRSRRDR